MMNGSNTHVLACAVVSRLIVHFRVLIGLRSWAWLLLALACCQSGYAQLAITEVMSTSVNTFLRTNIIVGGPDYWELSNFGTNEIDLTGYRFNDKDGGINQAFAPSFEGVVIRAHESIIFYESNSLSADAFRAWWGLGANVQVIPYTNTGYGLAQSGDAVFLWGSDAVDEADLLDFVEFGKATPGSSFTYDSITGEWGVPSVPGVGGAFRAATADDIGSPGTNTGPIVLSVAEQPVS